MSTSLSASALVAEPVGGQRAGRLLALASIAISTSVLLGWATGNRTLTSVLPHYIAMKANTAACLGLLGLSICLLSFAPSPRGSAAVPHRLWRARAAGTASVIVIAVGLATLSEYLFGVNLGIDELLFLDPDPGGRFPPGRLAPITAVLLIWLASSHLLLITRNPGLVSVAQGLTVVTFFAAFQALAGYASGVTYTFGSAYYTQMALQTSISFALLCAATLLLNPEHGLAKVLLGRAETARVMRILLIAAMVVPLLVNWVVLKGQALGLYDEDFAVLFRVMASVLFLGLVVWEKGSALQLDDARRQELEVQARLVNQARFKDEFLSHVSHELRSPLTAVKQFTTILLGGLGGALTPEQRQYQQIVLKNVLQLQSMIDDLLEVVRLQTGKLALKLHPVSVSDAVAYAVNTLQPVAQDRAVSLAASVPPDLPKAQADESRLQQILVILLDNAIKFTGSGGRIRIEAVRQPDDPRFLRIDVADTGCGMSPGAAEKIFDRLYQVEGTAESSRKGLGLGLHICQELVTRQGGQIRVDSTPGEGSVFSFTLPIAAAPQNLEGSGTAGMDEDVRGLTHGS